MTNIQDPDDLPSLAPLHDAADIDSGSDATYSDPSELPSPFIVPPTTADAPPQVSLAGLKKMFHPNHSSVLSAGKNLLQQMDDDEYAPIRNSKQYDVHYPFVSRADWQLAKWLTNSSLPQSEIDAFLRLEYVSILFTHALIIHLTLVQVKQVKPSFSSAREIQSRIEGLPYVPGWSHQHIIIPHYRTKDPITLYWRDGLEVVKNLFSNPVFAGCLEVTPYRLIEEETGERAYGEFMSGAFAWNYQVHPITFVSSAKLIECREHCLRAILPLVLYVPLTRLR